jgi:outer membrane protein, multidrug efflux system
MAASSPARPARRAGPLLVPVLTAYALLLSGCMVGPDYRRPETAAPAAWKNPPADIVASGIGGKWWELYNDTTLNGLEEQADQASPQLMAAVARVTQARAIARITEADFYPSASLDPSVDRTRQSGNRPIQPGSPATAYVANRFRVPLTVSYEVDLWGKIRRASESVTAQARAVEAAYATVRLTLHADVAQTYFAIRSLDTEYDILRRTIEFQKQGTEIIRSRYRGGAASELDVVRADAEVATNESDLIAVQRRRAELEQALAVLVGKMPADFTLAANPLDILPPPIPIGLPSELLQRRPDVAQAERLVAARNAEIGVAQAAYFPSIQLTGGFGFESTDLSDLIKTDSRIWTFGAGLTQPIFEGGRIRGNVERAKAAYDENLAIYRHQVLVAFQEVETALSGLRLLAEQADAQARAVTNSDRAAGISASRYRAGLVYFLEVLDAERTRLSNQRLAAQIQGAQLVTSIGLIKALGGGWRDEHGSGTDKVSSN